MAEADFHQDRIDEAMRKLVLENSRELVQQFGDRRVQATKQTTIHGVSRRRNLSETLQARQRSDHLLSGAG